MKTSVCTILGMDSQAGLNMARYYRKKGYHIALLDWSRKALEFNQEILRKEFEEVNAFIIEGSEYADIQYAFQKIYAHLGATEVFIYNKSTVGKQTENYSASFFSSLRKNLFTAGYALDQILPTMEHNKKGEAVFIGYEFDLFSKFSLGKAFIQNMKMEFKHNHIKLIAPVRGQFKSLTPGAKPFPYTRTAGYEHSRKEALPPFVHKPAARY